MAITTHCRTTTTTVSPPTVQQAVSGGGITKTVSNVQHIYTEMTFSGNQNEPNDILPLGELITTRMMKKKTSHTRAH